MHCWVRVNRNSQKPRYTSQRKWSSSYICQSAKMLYKPSRLFSLVGGFSTNCYSSEADWDKWPKTWTAWHLAFNISQQELQVLLKKVPVMQGDILLKVELVMKYLYYILNNLLPGTNTVPYIYSQEMGMQRSFFQKEHLTSRIA